MRLQLWISILFRLCGLPGGRNAAMCCWVEPSCSSFFMLTRRSLIWKFCTIWKKRIMCKSRNWIRSVCVFIPTSRMNFVHRWHWYWAHWKICRRVIRFPTRMPRRYQLSIKVPYDYWIWSTRYWNSERRKHRIRSFVWLMTILPIWYTK